jgi:hypothetical protein
MPLSKAKKEALRKKRQREEIAKKAKAKLRKRLFAAHVMNPNSDTFCHYTKSAQKVFPNMTEGSAQNMGSHFMKDKFVLNEIERIVEESGIGFADRVNALRDIIYGNCSREAIQHVRDPKTGEWKEITKQVSSPTFTERINAMKVLNQIDGTNQKASSIVSQRNKLLTKMRKALLRDLTKNGRDEVLRDVSELDIENEEKTLSAQSSRELDAFLTGKEGAEDAESKSK